MIEFILTNYFGSRIFFFNNVSFAICTMLNIFNIQNLKSVCSEEGELIAWL